MKTRSKYILLLFMGIIVLLLGGIFFVAQQEKEGPITAEASGPVYWLSEGSSLSTTSCLLCGQSVSASSGTSVAWQSTGTCSMDYYHWGPRGARICYAPITVHNGHFYQMDATCTKDGESYTVCTRCGTRTNETTIPATGHDYGEWFVATPATCTQNGTEQRVCQNSGCSARETRTIEATGHTWDSGTVTVSATCQRTGTRKYECTACGETKTETIAKRSHNYNIYLSRVEPTCTASGRTAGYECQWCYANTCSTIPALGHDLEYHDGQPATCTEAGWNNYETCSRCEYTTYREIAATGHTPGAAATCTTPQTCTECGAILVEALGHKTVSHLGQDPTCTAEGWKPYETCENCDYTTYEIIPALGHSFTSYVSNNDATCTDDGTETAKCDRCEVTDTRTDEGSALGHDWAEEWTTDGTAHWHECSRCDEINDKANHSGGTATCIALAKCEICGVEYGSALGHTEGEPVRENEVPAICTEAGSYDEVVYCSVCGDELSREEKVIDALGHSFTSYISNNDASCTEDGTETAKCDRCDVTDTRTDDGSALGHDWSDEWTTDGTLHWHECTRCDEINDKANHRGGTATCTKPAECKVCGAEYGEALGHTEDEAVRENEVPANCTIAGSYDEVVYCSVCGDELSREEKVIDALGHDLKHHEAKPATCTEVGWNAYETCSRCDYTTYRELAAKGHTPGTPATCTEAQICTVCGTTLTAALGHEFKNGYCVRCGVPEDIAFESAKEDTKSDLDEISQEIKDKIDSSDLPDEVKEELKDIIDEIIGDAKDDVNGALDYDDLNDIVHDAEQKIEDAVQNAEKDDTKTELDEIAQNAKDEIDASDLPDDVKEDLKDKIDEIIGGAKDEVNGELTKEELDQVIEDTKNEIEDAVQNAEKDDTKTELDEIAQNAKEEIDASDLPDDVKEDLKDKIDEIIGGAKDEVDGSIDFDDVGQAVEDARQEIEDMILNAEKDDAKSDLDEIVQNAKDEIDASDLSDEEKNELKGKLDEVLSSAKEEIGNATSKEEVDAIVNDVRKDIEDLLNGSSGDEISEEKEVAVSDLENTVQNAKDEIGASDLSDEEKDELKGKLDEVLSSAKEEIGIAATTEEIEEVLTSVKEEIAALTGNLTEGQSDTSPLWPWLIAAVVISAALAAVFAWRHVKSVRGKGETIGVKSVVTIAVATILIFVLVIGIVLLIFAMI